jgi:predicted ATP-binding protein involved in virulence
LRLTSIHLLNFRSFERCTLGLHPQMTVLTGPNASGKSAICEAITVALEAVPWQAGLQVAGIRPAFLRHHRTSSGGATVLAVAEPTCVEAFGHVADLDCMWSRSRNGLAGRTSRSGLGAISVALPAGLGGHGLETAWPVVAGFDSLRLQRDRGRTKADIFPGSRLQAYEDCFSPLNSFGHILSWLRRQTYAAVQSGQPTVHLEAVLRILVACLPEASNVHFSIQEEQLVVQFADGGSADFDSLNAGYRAILSLVADIAWRCVVLNAHLGARAPAETEGVVVIDDIEIHLDANWQRHVLAELMRTFPKIQFIVTTHSPQLIASCQPEWLRVLTMDAQVQLVVDVYRRDPTAAVGDTPGNCARPVA